MDVREFVAGQCELLELELQEDSSQDESDTEERAAHVLGNLAEADVSVGLYGRTVVQLGVWSDNMSTRGKLLPAHRFTVGDEVEIRSKKKNQAPAGVVCAVAEESISIALFQSPQASGNQKNSPDTESAGDDQGVGIPPLTVVPRSSIEVHKKLVQALDVLGRKGCDHPVAGQIVQASFSPDVSTSREAAPTSKSPLKLFNDTLDESQKEAISFALEGDSPVSLIHGPPGTGKTTTVAELIRQAVYNHNMKVLVTAPSNVAVDNILEHLVKKAVQAAPKSGRKAKSPALRAIRLGHPARLKPSILSYSLEALVQNAEGTEIVGDVRNELQSFLRVASNPKARPNDRRIAYREIKTLRKEIRKREERVVDEMISSAQVVLATTVGAANRILNRVEPGFDLVVIDEAAQALEASCWIPLLRAKKAVLAGDHCQLPPTIKSKNRRVQAGLGRTLFERLLHLYGDNDNSIGTPRISRMLKVQYRMHEDIAGWASKVMYNGELLTHCSVKDQKLNQLSGVEQLGDPDDNVTETTLLHIDTAGCSLHESVTPAGSKFNQGEAEVVARHVKGLLEVGLQQHQLCIITPYNGQVDLLRTMLLPEYPKVEIRSVDGFQGGERDAVVLSLVRSSDRGGQDGIGFLSDNRRLNVAVTRAKRHLAVICDSETVSRSTFISSLLMWIEDNGEQRSAMDYIAGTSTQADEEDLMLAEESLLRISESTASVATTNKFPTFTPTGEDEKILQKQKHQALLDKITAFMEGGKVGDEMHLSSGLSSFDRRLVHEFAEQIGLGHRSEGIEGEDRRIILTVSSSAPAVTPPQKESAEGEHHDVGVGSDVAQAHSAFVGFNIDDSDSELEREGKETMTPTSKPGNVAGVDSSLSTSLPLQVEAPSTENANVLLADLARERAERQGQSQTSKPPAKPKKKKKKKGKGQVLGGAKKPQQEEPLDDLDDMAFLDAQIEKSQTSHGRKVQGSGKGYRTIVNGILNARPEPRAAQTNTRASSSLQAKLKESQAARQKKSSKGKRK